LPHFCDEWGPDACEIEIDSQKLDVLGDFFVVRGRVVNRLACTLPHLQLRMVMHYKDHDHPPMRQGIYHITDRALEPGESCPFKIEGEYDDGMHHVEIDVWPSDPTGGLHP